MKLTSELFEQITGVKESSLEQSPPPKHKSECRSAPRLPLGFRSSACRVNGDQLGPPVHVQICDISVMGIGLIHASGVRLGKTFVIALSPRGTGKPVAIHCETANFQSAGQTRVRVGARFVRLGTDQDLCSCLCPPHTSVPATVKLPHAAPSPLVTVPASAISLSPNVCRAPVPFIPPVETLGADPEQVKRIRDAMLS